MPGTKPCQQPVSLPKGKDGTVSQQAGGRKIFAQKLAPYDVKAERAALPSGSPVGVAVLARAAGQVVGGASLRADNIDLQVALPVGGKDDPSI